jgi:hypothetical protein
MPRNLIKLVKVAMENAIENGYYDNIPTNEELALDLQMCDSDIEKYSLEEIIEALELIRELSD